MTFPDLVEMLTYARSRTLLFLDTIAKLPNPKEALGWRPGPGRAHLAWHLMHIAATDDRHVHVRMTGGQPAHPDLVQRFAGGSTPDDAAPSLDEIKAYLESQRTDLNNHLSSLDPSMLEKKPNDQAPWTYREWIKLLTWHECHHQGQAHAILTLYKAAHGI